MLRFLAFQLGAKIFSLAPKSSADAPLCFAGQSSQCAATAYNTNAKMEPTEAASAASLSQIKPLPSSHRTTEITSSAAAAAAPTAELAITIPLAPPAKNNGQANDNIIAATSPGQLQQRRSGRKRNRPRNYSDTSSINSSDDEQQQRRQLKPVASPRIKNGKKTQKHSNNNIIIAPPHVENTASPSLVDKELLSKLPEATVSKYFEEESSWRFHNPDFPTNSHEQLTKLRDESSIPSMKAAVTSDKLPPIPPPPALPPFPDTGYCKWSFDAESRVLYANFRDTTATLNPQFPEIKPLDEEFLLRMMERDDITVISEGLADEISSSLWTREYIVGCIGSEYHHKFRAFQKKTRTVANTTNDKQTTSTTTIEYHEEKSGWYSMKFSSYFDYLEKRRNVQEKGGDDNSGNSNDRMFSFEDCNGKEHSIDAEEVSLVSVTSPQSEGDCSFYLLISSFCNPCLDFFLLQYMIDVDLPKLLPRSFEDFQNKFKLSSILPGGSHCMMNAVS